MKIEIDKNSGFCFGVVNAIEKAEEELNKGKELYCLGDIVHNEMEVKRLKKKGLITIDNEKYRTLRNCSVLIRAHGEPPLTYKIAKENNIKLIDASCPVVLRLQERIKKGYRELEKQDGQIVIFGKHGHAEVNGLVGQIGGNAIVVNSEKDLDNINYSAAVNIFSQTTMRLSDYKNLTAEIKKRLIKEQGENYKLTTNDTVCRQVSNKDKKLREFALKHDIIIFVSGKKSSNGNMLFKICKEENERAYFVSEVSEILPEWFNKDDSVGICGATSTPAWLMKEVAQNISDL